MDLICQLLEALEYAHARKLVHRDIKPANMLIKEENGREVVKLADFGLGRIYQASALSGLTMTGMHAGTPAFMPPEQILQFRNVRPTADQYAAAATLYNLLTGKYLYEGSMRLEAMLLKILHERPVSIRDRNTHIPQRLADSIHRAMERDPANRYPGIREFRIALIEFCS